MKQKSNKYINSLIAYGAALILLSAGLAGFYKYSNTKKYWLYTGMALANTTCVGFLAFLKDKSKQK